MILIFVKMLSETVPGQLHWCGCTSNWWLLMFYKPAGKQTAPGGPLQEVFVVEVLFIVVKSSSDGM